MGMIPGTFLIVDDTTAPKQNEAPVTQPAEPKNAALETYHQRFMDEVKRLWQRLELFYQEVWAGK